MPSSRILAGLADASLLFLLGAGFTLVFGVTKRPNLAHGAFAMLGTYGALGLLTWLPGGPVNLALGIVAAALSVALLGCLVEIALFRRLSRRPTLLSLLASLALAFLIREGTMQIWGRATHVLPDIDRLDVVQLIQLAVGPTVLCVLLLVLKHTHWGWAVRAAMLDRSMVAALGVDQRWLCGSVAALGAGLAGLAGALSLPTAAASPGLDLAYLIESLVVAVAGGIGSLTGAYVAALLIGLLRALGADFSMLAFALLFAVLVIRPAGLLRRRERDARPTSESFHLLHRTPLTVRLLGVVAGLLAIAAPIMVGLETLSVIIEASIAVLFAASLHVLMGPGGMPSLGHAAFFGIGAYAVALLVNLVQTPVAVALIAAALVAALVALIVGAIIVRHASMMLALLTLVFAQTLWSVADRVGSLGGVTPFPWAGDPAVHYWLTLALCIAATLLLRRALSAPFGYALRATRDNPLRARSIGLPVYAIRLAAFTLAGAAAGLAGGLSMFTNGRVSSADLDITRSFDAASMVVLGGVQTLSGPIVGALVYCGLQDAAMQFTTALRPLLGPAVMALALLIPAGIAGTSIRAWRRGT